MAFITPTEITRFGERILTFTADGTWEAVLGKENGEEKIVPLVGWAVLEQSRGSGSSHTALVGVWAVDGSGYLETMSDWAEAQAQRRPEDRWAFKRYRRIADRANGSC